MTIPRGTSNEDRELRRKIIKDFYRSWVRLNPKKTRYNPHLHGYIHITSLSVSETANHASKSYLSTLMILRHFDEILSSASIINEVDPKRNKNQRQFWKMIILQHPIPFIGTAKLTVGVKRTNQKNIQYALTAMN